MSSEVYAQEFFFDQPPAETLLAELPAAARDVVVAKVRIIGGVSSLLGRDQSGRPPPLTKDSLHAWVEITDVIRGAATVNMRFDGVFGKPGTELRYKFPHTQSMLKREYFIVSYVGGDGIRRLLGSPVSLEVYEKWYEEVREYRRARGRPGASQE